MCANPGVLLQADHYRMGFQAPGLNSKVAAAGQAGEAPKPVEQKPGRLERSDLVAGIPARKRQDYRTARMGKGEC